MSERLIDAETAEPIGEATPEQLEWARYTLDETGIFLIDAEGRPVSESRADEVWVPKPVRRVYIEA